MRKPTRWQYTIDWRQEKLGRTGQSHMNQDRPGEKGRARRSRRVVRGPLQILVSFTVIFVYTFAFVLILSTLLLLEYFTKLCSSCYFICQLPCLNPPAFVGGWPSPYERPNASTGKQNKYIIAISSRHDTSQCCIPNTVKEYFACVTQPKIIITMPNICTTVEYIEYYDLCKILHSIPQE